MVDSAAGPGQARTRLARTAVVDAARVLFSERGYPGTTVDAVSERSGVPPATVYRLFGSKLGILRALLDVTVSGDTDAAPLSEQQAARTLLAEPDPRRQLAGFAAVCREVNARTATLYRVLVSAAESDPEAAGLLAERARLRARGQDRIAHALAAHGALDPALDEASAADIVHALMSPEVYRLLVTDRGWDSQRYEQWLAGTLIDQLLPR